MTQKKAKLNVTLNNMTLVENVMSIMRKMLEGHVSVENSPASFDHALEACASIMNLPFEELHEKVFEEIPCAGRILLITIREKLGLSNRQIFQFNSRRSKISVFDCLLEDFETFQFLILRLEEQFQTQDRFVLVDPPEDWNVSTQ